MMAEETEEEFMTEEEFLASQAGGSPDVGMSEEEYLATLEQESTQEVRAEPSRASRSRATARTAPEPPRAPRLSARPLALSPPAGEGHQLASLSSHTSWLARPAALG